MNEKIKQLAEQVGAVQNVLAMGRHDGVLFTETELERFVELIVQECALIAGLMEYEGRKGIGAQILDRFEIPVSNIEAAESLHSDKGYSLGTPEAQEAFESKRGYKL